MNKAQLLRISVIILEAIIALMKLGLAEEQAISRIASDNKISVTEAREIYEKVKKRK